MLASLTEVLLRLVLGAKAPLGPLDEKGKEYQPSGVGGTRSPPAMSYRLLNPNWLTGGPQNGKRGPILG